MLETFDNFDAFFELAGSFPIGDQKKFSVDFLLFDWQVRN
jgi:hypothetical protein